jgi:hypothetical protein
MSINWPEQTDEQLANEAQTGLRGQGAVVESNRRLRNTIAALRESTATQASTLIRLTWAIVALTLAMLLGLVIQIWLAWRRSGN